MERQTGHSPAANDVMPEAGDPAALHDLVNVAARAMQVPIALIALDGAATGLRGLVAAIADDAWVGDHATVDVARLADPRLAADYGLAFYAGVPLRNADDDQIGTLAVLDRTTRTVSDDDLVTLTRLARLAAALCASSATGAR